MMIALKIAAVAVFVVAWLRSRTGKTAEISDFFTLSFLIIFVPGFLFNPSGETSLNALHFPELAIKKAELAMVAMLLVGTLVMLLRSSLESGHRKRPDERDLPALSSRSTDLAWGAWVLSALMFAALLLHPEFRDFKLNVLRFFAFQFEGSDYRFLRNVRYAHSWLIESALGRARFTALPILFCLMIHPLLTKRYAFAAGMVALAFYIALPASLSKLPVFFFAGYFALLMAARFPRLLDLRWISIMSMVGACMVITLLVLLYAAQYQSSVINGAVLPLNLAIERIWSEPYSIIVRYFFVYPDLQPLTGWAGISLVAQWSDIPVRMPDIEVARATLGPDSGSNPGVFFLGGYAAFGWAGLFVYVLSGWLLLWGLDWLNRKIRQPALRTTYFAVMAMNVFFLNQIALQTTLLTYGLVVVPLLIVGLDRLLATPWHRNTPFNVRA